MTNQNNWNFKYENHERIRIQVRHKPPRHRTDTSPKNKEMGIGFTPRREDAAVCHAETVSETHLLGAYVRILAWSVRIYFGESTHKNWFLVVAIGWMNDLRNSWFTWMVNPVERCVLTRHLSRDGWLTIGGASATSATSARGDTTQRMPSLGFAVGFIYVYMGASLF